MLRPPLTRRIRPALFLAALAAAPALSARAQITAAWANEGGDKVTQDELRASQSNGRKVLSRLWDGKKISLAGAKNEVLNFNLILEAAQSQSQNVHVELSALRGPAGSSIQSKPVDAKNIFDWVGRPVELFYVRYLQIKGLSRGAYENYYDERHVPERFRRPWTGDGKASAGTTWQNRPDHDKFYPDIAVPLELVPAFSIAAAHNQSVWADIYITSATTAGLYTGELTITEKDAPAREIPVELAVYNFALPDVPTAKTMLAMSAENVNERYLGKTWIQGPDHVRAKLIQDRHFLLAHRHKISLIGDDTSINEEFTREDHPTASWAARLNGDFFTAKNHYEGPGINVGNNIYSIGTYGTWKAWGDTEAHMRQHSDNWVQWFEKNAPDTDYFLYLIDESSDYPKIERWASWLKQNPGPGRHLKSMATIPLPQAVAHTPNLSIAVSVAAAGPTGEWSDASEIFAAEKAKQFFLYNGMRPGAGTFATEDDGVALRVNAWIQYKKHVQRWFYWESTYYNDFQGNAGKGDLFLTAHTFGQKSKTDPVQGETGENYCNGDGVLFYPGTDHLFPTSSYNVDGPFASLRLKYWRRGIQDHDYLSLAAAINPEETTKIVNQLIPKVVWEVGVSDPKDPTWVKSNISWSTDPDVWEAARARLAEIILSKPKHP